VPEQAVLTTPILPGTYGVQRMSKSAGNYIGVTDPPDEMYGKTMSIPDSTLKEWYVLLLGEPPDRSLGPRDAKRALARSLVDRFHGPGAGERAEQEFDRIHIERRVPDEIPTIEVEIGDGVVHLPAVLAEAFGISSSEARRTLGQGGVRIDGEVVDGATLDVPAESIDGRVVQVGKRRFARVRVR
jgi:tyrosyl-tRNA synthetase